MNLATTLTPAFRINPELDLAAARADFLHDGHVRIERFLAGGAPEFFQHLSDKEDWIQLVNHESGVHEVAWTDWIAKGSKLRAKIEPVMFERACDGFQYSYSALRIPNSGEDYVDPWLGELARFMHSPAITDLLGAATGTAMPRFTDGQVTAYGSGDFLTGHDDDLAGSSRNAAFVLGLTPQWRTEWGGLLLFHEPGQVGLSGIIPQFNTLNLFKVPKYHSVTMVTPAAPRRRFAVTGWLSTK